MATKAELQEYIRQLESAFDSLMASHRDCTSGYGFDIDWAEKVQLEANQVRWGHKECSASPWRPIETAPKDGTEVQAWVSGNRRHQPQWEPRMRWMNNRWEFLHSHGWFDLNLTESIFGRRHPTHWMPLPTPPEGTP